jgi:chromosome segregation ATPase
MQKDLKSLFGTHHGLDERSLDALIKALSKENLPGFDYIEFKQAIGRLQDMGMDESTIYRSAFATASTMGLTKEKLLKTAAHYQKVLAHEQSQFEQSLKRQMAQRVEAKRQEVEKMKHQVQEYRKKIADLEQKIKQGEQTITNADGEIQEVEERLLSTKESFEHALRSIVNAIEEDIKSINTYL